VGYMVILPVNFQRYSAMLTFVHSFIRGRRRQLTLSFRESCTFTRAVTSHLDFRQYSRLSHLHDLLFIVFIC